MNTHTLFTPSVWRGRDAVPPSDGSTHADAGGLGEMHYDPVEAPATPEQKELPETLSPQHVRLADLAGQKIRTILTRAPGKHKRPFVKEELE